jgi:hypothetical protein
MKLVELASAADVKSDMDPVPCGSELAVDGCFQAEEHGGHAVISGVLRSLEKAQSEHPEQGIVGRPRSC